MSTGIRVLSSNTKFFLSIAVGSIVGSLTVLSIFPTKEYNVRVQLVDNQIEEETMGEAAALTLLMWGGGIAEEIADKDRKSLEERIQICRQLDVTEQQREICIETALREGTGKH